MSLPFPLNSWGLLLLATLALAGALRARARTRSQFPHEGIPGPVLEAEAHLNRWRIGALLIGVVAYLALQLAGTGTPFAQLLIAFAAGGSALAGIAHAERTSPIARTSRRAATLAPRTVSRIVPARLAMVVALEGFLLVALLGFWALRRPGGRDWGERCGLVAPADPLDPPSWAAHFAPVILLGAYLAMLALVLMALRATVDRPAAEPGLAAPDGALRRWSAAGTLHLAGLVTTLNAALLGALILSVRGCAAGSTGLRWEELALLAVAAGLTVFHLVGLVQPPRFAPTVPSVRERMAERA